MNNNEYSDWNAYIIQNHFQLIKVSITITTDRYLFYMQTYIAGVTKINKPCTLLSIKIHPLKSLM